MITKPMLAATCKNEAKLKFPLLATPKLDGIRCLIVMKDGRKQAVSRNFKPIPNHFVRESLERECPVGFDGELLIKNANFNDVTSGIMSRDGEPDFIYMVFDYVAQSLIREYEKRMMDLFERLPYGNPMCEAVLPKRIYTHAQLDALEESYLAAGYEGVMVRTPNSPYKLGRSSENEGYLVKIKRFEDDEAIITGAYEEQHNANEVEIDQVGNKFRSSKKAGKSGKNLLGGFYVHLLKNPEIKFKIGSGFDAIDREILWKTREMQVGKIVKFRHQPSGALDKPRFPVFIGFRHENDI